jgi:hypothetical protein
MRLPVQVPSVLRGAFHGPTPRRLPGLAPSSFSSMHVESITCAQTLCNCPAGAGHNYNTYACCRTNECHWDAANSMCACGAGAGK